MGVLAQTIGLAFVPSCGQGGSAGDSYRLTLPVSPSEHGLSGKVIWRGPIGSN